jgi:two-component system sporulation sensor kinase A
MASVPLIAEGELMGSLNLSWDTAISLTPEQENIAREMAARLAMAIYQAQMHKEVERHADKLERSMVKRTAALHASEARFRTVFENATVGFALIDSTGRILTSNPALQEMLGYSAEELRGMHDDQFIHPEDRKVREELFRELMAGKRTQFKVEKRYIRKDGMEDVTEYRKAREALIQAERLTLAGHLGASLAHEINNPLQAVIGSLGLAREMLEAEDEAQLYLEIAIEELERAAGIVSQLHNLNRKSDPALQEPTQVNEIAEKVLRLSAKQCEAQQVGVAWEPAVDLPLISIVPDRIRQVFLNLVLNAIGAMPAGGQLQVSTARTEEPEGVLVSVADTGKGIEPDFLPHLFEPFQSTRPEGLGLGLYISRSIVEEHGGRIEVESQAGQGTRFSVWLPAQGGSK